MEEYSYDLKIPKERVAVLIGEKGSVKKQLEEDCSAKIEIDSKEGDVVVIGKDAIKLYTLREIIKAIGRGFNPDVAMLLEKQDYVYEKLNLSEYVKTKNSAVRLKGRVIGRSGKSRKKIEELTECYIVVYGKTIGIIGEATNVAAARKAVVSLLTGSTHSSVFRSLERSRAANKTNALDSI
jgi:ribosomal RNA assembly protein